MHAAPFFGCEVLLDLDGDLRAQSFAVALEGQRQPFLVENVERENGRMTVDGFTCLDGHPITPIRCHPQGRFTELEPRALYAVEYAAFCEQFEAGDGAYGACADGESLAVEGVLLRCSRRRNSLTGAGVFLATLWIPGALVPVCCPSDAVPAPGTDVRAQLELYLSVFQEL